MMSDTEFGDYSLIKLHQRNITTRRSHAVARSRTPTGGSSHAPKFSLRLMKRMFDTLQLPCGPGLTEEVFNSLTSRFIDLELAKSAEMSHYAGLGSRIVYSEVLGDGKLDEEILLQAMQDCDLEVLKQLEGVLYSNQALRRRRHDAHLIQQRVKGQELPEVLPENGPHKEDLQDDTVDLHSLDSHIALGIQHQDGVDSSSSDYEIPLAEEESESESEH